MSISQRTEPVPLAIGPDEVIRIGETRVTLETVITAFNEGAAPEDIQSQYPVLDLADIYDVVGHYLRHQEEINRYMDDREAQHASVKAANEQKYAPAGLRARLLARRTRKDV